MHGYIQALTESKATDHDATLIMAIKTSFPQTLQNRLTKNLGVLSASAVRPTTNDKKLKGRKTMASNTPVGVTVWYDYT